MSRVAEIAAKLALEVRFFGHCRGPVHRPLLAGKIDTRPCDCRHCESLREYDAMVAIVQTPATAAAQASSIGDLPAGEEG